MYHDMDREERSSMIEMTEAEYGVLGEDVESEYGICDLLDENIPSPLETDNAGETLVLPEIQDMTEYDRITAVQNGASLEWVATAENGWHAVVVNARVGWVSGKYSVME